MRKCVLILSFLMACSVGYSQSYKMHTVYIFSFTRYVIWPEGADQGDFEITVLGDTPMYEALQELAQSKKVGERSIKITKVQSVSEIKACNILFVPAAKSGMLGDVIGKINTQPTLIITEEQGLGAKGSDINFIMKEGKLVFELNQAATSKHNLKVSNQLVSLAILI
jgi:hypothetical protein